MAVRKALFGYGYRPGCRPGRGVVCSALCNGIKAGSLVGLRFSGESLCTGTVPPEGCLILQFARRKLPGRMISIGICQLGDYRQNNFLVDIAQLKNIVLRHFFPSLPIVGGCADKLERLRQFLLNHRVFQIAAALIYGNRPLVVQTVCAFLFAARIAVLSRQLLFDPLGFVGNRSVALDSGVAFGQNSGIGNRCLACGICRTLVKGRCEGNHRMRCRGGVLERTGQVAGLHSHNRLIPKVFCTLARAVLHGNSFGFQRVFTQNGGQVVAHHRTGQRSRAVAVLCVGGNRPVDGVGFVIQAAGLLNSIGHNMVQLIGKGLVQNGKRLVLAAVLFLAAGAVHGGGKPCAVDGANRNALIFFKLVNPSQVKGYRRPILAEGHCADFDLRLAHLGHHVNRLRTAEMQPVRECNHSIVSSLDSSAAGLVYQGQIEGTLYLHGFSGVNGRLAGNLFSLLRHRKGKIAQLLGHVRSLGDFLCQRRHLNQTDAQNQGQKQGQYAFSDARSLHSLSSNLIAALVGHLPLFYENVISISYVGYRLVTFSKITFTVFCYFQYNPVPSAVNSH